MFTRITHIRFTTGQAYTSDSAATSTVAGTTEGIMASIANAAPQGSNQCAYHEVGALSFWAVQ
jgi:hypothetical protein